MIIQKCEKIDINPIEKAQIKLGALLFDKKLIAIPVKYSN